MRGSEVPVLQMNVWKNAVELQDFDDCKSCVCCVDGGGD